ncbi:hypothetical protein [Nostoc sp. CMAA1605]|nr:hypothetical protein [Nostoc sp. CMAA1605]
MGTCTELVEVLGIGDWGDKVDKVEDEKNCSLFPVPCSLFSNDY